MINLIRKFFVTALLITVVGAALPFNSASAASLIDTSTPPASGKTAKTGTQSERLDLAFARLQEIVTRIGLEASSTENIATKTQALIDHAAKNGTDTTALQTALSAYKSALEQGLPYYTQAASIAAGHDGFDATGKVYDPALAKTTLKALSEAIKQLRAAVEPALKNLHAALQTFRAANPKATATPVAP